MLHDARIAPAADGARLTGELFATAVKRWVDALNVGGGKSLSLRQVALEFGTERIAKAVDESIVEYRQRMSQSGDAAISRQDFEFVNIFFFFFTFFYTYVILIFRLET